MAEAAMHAGRPAAVGLRVDRHAARGTDASPACARRARTARRRTSPASAASGRASSAADRTDSRRQGRRRRLPTPPWCSRARARRSVIGQSSKPVPAIAPSTAALDEIDLVKAPVVRGEMHAAAADRARIPESGLNRAPARLLLRILAEGLRVAGSASLVMPPRNQYLSSSCSKSWRAKPRPLLEQHDREAGLRQLARHDAAGGAGADDREIDRFAGAEAPRAHACFRCPCTGRSRDSRDRSSRTAARRRGGLRIRSASSRRRRDCRRISGMRKHAERS